MSASPVDSWVLWLFDERRRAARHHLHLSLNGDLRTDGSTEVLIQDLSINGFSLQAAITPKVGTWISVELPYHGPAFTQVMWTDGSRAGCKFDRPLPKAVISALRLVAQPRMTRMDEERNG